MLTHADVCWPPSSVDPNLQSIPSAGEGNVLRQAFVAPPGHVLLSADYSQIELRLLAHMAQVPALQLAFANKVDVHRLTASQVFKAVLRLCLKGCVKALLRLC
jgi:DNA polymerase-1